MSVSVYVCVCVCAYANVCVCAVPPTIRGSEADTPEEKTVLVNKTTQLECVVDGSPTPQISWLKDNQPITTGGSLRILSNGRTLQVGQVRE